MQKAIDAIINGELVIIPTETVYGLAADATNEDAVNKIFFAKGRPQDNPLIVHVADKEEIFMYTQDQPDYLDSLIDAFCPGPLTFVLNKDEQIPDIVTAGLNTVAIRIPNNELTLKLIRDTHLPLAAPSANVSGRPSATSLEDALSDFGGTDLVSNWIDGGKCQVGIESTVIKCEEDKILIMRPGNITKEKLVKVVDIPVELYTGKESLSPGVKYKHYSPNVKIKLISNLDGIDPQKFLILDVTPNTDYQILNQISLYYWFRQAEKMNKDIAILKSDHLLKDLALYDRIKRASDKMGLDLLFTRVTEPQPLP